MAVNLLVSGNTSTDNSVDSVDNDLKGGTGRIRWTGGMGWTSWTGPTGSSALRRSGRERSAVKNSSGFVAHLLKDAADGAVLFSDAFFTRDVCGLADARDERKRTIERA